MPLDGRSRASWHYGFHDPTHAGRFFIVGSDPCNGCDVLIHEAYSMMTHEQATPEHQAERKNLHTSSYELAEIANEAKPKLLVLYHRSNLGGRGGPNPEEILVEEIKKT